MRRVLARPRTAAVAAVVAAAFCAMAWFAAPAAGHAIVRDTTPAADETVATSPSQVVMRFNESVELAFGAIRVYDTDARRVDDGDARHAGDRRTIAVALDDDLAAGTYTVTWRVVSADGHPIREAFVFHVGQPGERASGIAEELLAGEPGAGPAPSALAGVARFVLFASLLVLGGATALRLLVWRDDRLRRPFLVAAAVAGAATVVLFVLQGALAGDVPVGDAMSGSVLRDVADTRYGAVALARLALLAAAVAVARTQWPAAVTAAPVLLVLATPGLAGHAGTTPPVALNVIADVVHVSSAAAWVGGLLLLWRVVFPALAGDDDAVRGVLSRFSTLAFRAVALLVATGVWRSMVEVRSIDAIDTTYGVLLASKVVAFAPMLAFGFVNQRWLRGEVDDAPVRKLRRNVVVESALAAVVIVLTAVLVNVAPARVEAAGGGVFTTSVALGEGRVEVLVTPGRVGDNEVHLTAVTTAGAPSPVEAMEVLFTLPEDGIGPLTAAGTELAPGHFVVQGRQLSVAGRWVLEVVAKTGRFTEERATVTVDIG